ncbi:MAG: hypothetical protein ACLQMT_05075 [Candidatus Acidiferrales bacterium]
MASGALGLACPCPGLVESFNKDTNLVFSCFSGYPVALLYVAAAGGIVFSAANVPPGDTSSVDFTPQAEFGADIFIKRGSAVFLEGAVVHHSNDDLGARNPGYDAALFFTIGYSWFKNPR